MTLNGFPEVRPRRFDWMHPRGRVLAYSGLLAFNAGSVNAVALLVLAVPVGNLTGVTTQLGMDTAHPWRYESHVLTAILLGFLVGAAVAGALLASVRAPLASRHALILSAQAVLLLLAAAAFPSGTPGSDALQINAVKVHLVGLGFEKTAVQALLAAAALGLQNGLTSSFRGMAIRTTHFTGTVTDLGLMLGRSRQDGIDTWKIVTLTVTLLLFLSGGIAGILIGAQLGGCALLVPASICVAVAAANMVQGRERRAVLVPV